MMWHPFKWTVVVVEDLKQITNYVRLMTKTVVKPQLVYKKRINAKSEMLSEINN